MIFKGDSKEILKTMPDNYFDSMVTDPPYGLSKEPNALEVLDHWLKGDDYISTGGGFMGKKWDSFVPGPSHWVEAYRVIKPGGHALVFAGSRTQDLMCMALRIAGFEIRDTMMWLYGSGFPKSLNVGKATKSDELLGWGTALKPAYEPIIIARKPLDGTVANNVLTHGVGGINIDGCRVGPPVDTTRPVGKSQIGTFQLASKISGQKDKGRFPANVLHDGSDEVINSFPDAKGQQGALKNHNKKIKSPSGCYGTLLPRYDCEPRLDSTKSAARFFYCAKASKADRNAGLDYFNTASPTELTGGRAEGSVGLNSPRSGAGRTSGAKNIHPTVKPTELMRYLCRLVTPKNGTVLDPFAGSGSTGRGAALEGFKFIGMEFDHQYAEIAIARYQDAINEYIDRSVTKL